MSKSDKSNNDSKKDILGLPSKELNDSANVKRKFGLLTVEDKEAKFIIGPKFKSQENKPITQFVIDMDKGLLGVGTFASVYKAYPYDALTDTANWNVPIAVKVINDGTHPNYVRPESNAKALHWVVNVKDKYILMPFVAKSSRRYLRQLRPGDTRKRIDVALQLAVLLQILHNNTPKGCAIIHFDLKDDNIRISVDGKVFIFDFGLSHEVEPNGYPLFLMSTDDEKNAITVIDKDKDLTAKPVLLIKDNQFFMYGYSKNGKRELVELDSKVCKEAKLSLPEEHNKPKKILKNKVPEEIFKEIASKEAHNLSRYLKGVSKRGTLGYRAPEILAEGYVGVDADNFTFGGLLASILGAKNIRDSRRGESEKVNGFDVRGMLENDESLTPRQRQAIKDYQALMTSLDPEFRHAVANSDLTVRFLNSVKQLLLLNTTQQEKNKHEAQLILISNGFYPASINFNIQPGETKKGERSLFHSFDFENNPTFCRAIIALDNIGMFDKSNLDKTGKENLLKDTVKILTSDCEKCRKKFTDKYFLVLEEHKKQMEKYSIINEKIAREQAEKFEELDENENKERLMLLDELKENQDIKDYQERLKNIRNKKYKALREFSSNREYKKLDCSEIKLLEEQEDKQRELDAILNKIEKEEEKEKEIHQSRSKVIIELERDKLLSKKDLQVLMTHEHFHIYQVSQIQQPIMAYFYLYSAEGSSRVDPQTVDNKNLMNALKFLLINKEIYSKHIFNVEINNELKEMSIYERIFEVISNEIFTRMKDKQKSIRSGAWFPCLLTNTENEDAAISIIKDLLSGKVTVMQFLSEQKYATSRAILTNKTYSEFTKPLFGILEKFEVQPKLADTPKLT